MSILKNYWLRASATILTLVLGVFVAVGAMERGEVEASIEEAPASTTYYFTGNDLSQATDAEHWTDNPDEAPACQGAPVLPCSIALNESVEDFVSNKTPSQIMSTPGLSKRSN